MARQNISSRYYVAGVPRFAFLFPARVTVLLDRAFQPRQTLGNWNKNSKRCMTPGLAARSHG
jgi:hypothetical protein